MRSLPSRLAMAVVATALAFAVQARALTFEERVQAHAALERVYYSHQIGTSRPFEEAVPRKVLEEKVRKYLKQTVALAQYWHTSVTGEMLQAEMERQARETRMPERLRELYAALGDDPFLVRECLARPALVDRLTQNFFASDERFQGPARAEAEELRQGILRYGIEAFANDRHRSDVEVVQRQADDQETVGRIALDPDEFARWRSRAPALGQIGPLREEREAFVITAIIDERPGWARVASLRVPKQNWDAWWQEQVAVLDVSTMVTAEDDGGALPLVETTTSCLPDDTWDNGSLDDWPDTREKHTAVWTGSRMVIWGGNIGPTTMNSGGQYDPATDTWTPTSTAGAPESRFSHTAVWTGSLMLVWGGSNSSPTEHSLNSGGRYDPVTDTWLPTAIAGAPSVRAYHSAVWTDSRMVVWGGENGSSPPLGTGGRYDPVMDKWTPTSSAGVVGRSRHTAVWTGGQMVIWGGLAVTGPVNTGARYDPGTDTWTPTSTVGVPVARYFHTAVWTGSQMVVWGGKGSALLNTGGRYDPSTDTWTPTSIAGAPEARYIHTVAWTGSLMVVWGGSVGSSSYPTNTGGRYDPSTDTWTPTSIAGAPQGRLFHTTVWTGSLVVVWGGSGHSIGGRYDPITDSWTPVSNGGEPEARTSHTTVWTGNLMVVWGGTAIPPALDTGARYDPATDTWMPTSTLGAPTPRVLHTAVWTGSRMVVWGGAETLNTGGQYDPLTDTWTPTAIAGAPDGRAQHTAVWTGSVMVVWGGSVFLQALQSGGRYDPATDSWLPTSIVHAPAARFYHTAVWTGERMVVWGGGYVPMNTGGLYDPATDSWTPTSLAGAPVARANHTAVWTGSKMVVWGGYDATSGINLKTGGRYDPAADAWSATSTLAAPEGRYNHSAVWTGALMVVWGGEGESSSALSTGGRYDPADNTWTPTSTTGAPVPRDGHSAVWTGSAMVVWGGANLVTPLKSGGRYVVDPDLDSDGFTACEGDCDDADPGAHATPAEVTGQVFVDAFTLSWDHAAPGAGSATVHDVVRGLLSELPVGTGAAETCFASGIAEASTTDEATPPQGDGYWYLVRGRNSCAEGTYGADSAGVPRTSGACP